MILLVISPPSPLTQSLLAAARELIGSTCGKLDYIHLTTLDVLKEAWTKRSSDYVVMFLDRPDAALASMLSRVPLPIVFLAEDPVASARFVMDRHKVTAEEATRLVASSFASIQDIVCSANNLLRLLPEHFSTPGEVIGRLSAFLHLDDPAPPAGGSALVTVAAPPLGQMAATDVALSSLTGALTPFRAVSRMQPVTSAAFPTGLFMLTEPAGGYYHGAEIPLLGPARILLYGPYLHLPVGVWRFCIRFDVSDNVSGNALKLELLLGHDVVAHSLGTLPSQGVFDAWIEGAINEPCEPVQIRLGIQEGAIEGLLTLLQVDAVFKATPVAELTETAH